MRSTPRARAWAAAMATLLRRQKPIARAGRAWWPGGRKRATPFDTGPSIIASTIATSDPAARPRRSLPTRRCQGPGSRSLRAASREPRRSAGRERERALRPWRAGIRPDRSACPPPLGERPHRVPRSTFLGAPGDVRPENGDRTPGRRRRARAARFLQADEARPAEGGDPRAISHVHFAALSARMVAF